MKRLFSSIVSALLTCVVMLNFTVLPSSATFAASTGVEGFVERAYNLMLGREAEEAGKNFWCEKLNNKTITSAEMISQFVESNEFQGFNIPNDEVVEILYNVMLDRASDAAGKDYWMEFLNNGCSHRKVIDGFAKSTEFQNLCASFGIEAGSLVMTENRDMNENVTKFVNGCYKAILNRDGDVSGLNYWTGLINSKEVYPEELVYGFIHSNEGLVKIADDATYINTLYKAFLGREAEEQGFNYWINFIASGKSYDEVFDQFKVSTEFKTLVESYGMTTKPVIVKGDKLICLTFDDGPYSPVTNKILDLLEQYDGRATFFVVGDRVKTYESCVIRAEQLGCEIANHTYDHKSVLTSLSGSSVAWEISGCNEEIYKVLGHYPSIMRPVGGAYNSTVAANVGLPMIIWSVDTQDWKNRNAITTANAILNNAKDGDIVLMHDLYPSTAEAMAIVIPELAKQGFSFVTVSELAEAKGYDMVAGEAYNSFK